MNNINKIGADIAVMQKRIEVENDIELKSEYQKKLQILQIKKQIEQLKERIESLKN